MVAQLDATAQFLRGHAFAHNTKRSYSTHLNSYLEFCSLTGLPPFPISAQQATRYIAHLSQRLKYTSITKYINILRLLCLETEQPNPLVTWSVTSVLRGVRRVKGDQRDSKLPITPHMLLRIRSFLKLNQPLHCTLWAAYLTAFFSLLRTSNLVPPSTAAFDVNKHLCRGDLSPHDGGLLLTIKWSKTIQYKERSYQLPLPYIQGHPLCPVTALHSLLSMGPSLPPSTPLFAFPNCTGVTVLTRHTFTDHLHQHLQGCGFDTAAYSGHSFRRGGASWAFDSGLPGELVQVLGDWKSDSYKLYLEMNNNSKMSMISNCVKHLPTN